MTERSAARALRPPAGNDLAVGLLRIAVGVLFLIFAEYKVVGSQFVSGGFEMWIHRFLDGGATYPFMVPVLRGFVLAHASVLARCVSFGELAIGLALTFGFLSRVASVCGFVYMMTLLFASNYPGASAPGWEYFGAALDHLVLALCFAAFAVGNPDRELSVTARWRAIELERAGESVGPDDDGARRPGGAP